MISMIRKKVNAMLTAAKCDDGTGLARNAGKSPCRFSSMTTSVARKTKMSRLAALRRPESLSHRASSPSKTRSVSRKTVCIIGAGEPDLTAPVRFGETGG
jgi:hypothetical protein